MLCKGRSFTYGGFILTDEEEKYTIEIKKNEEYKPVPWKSALYSLIFPGLGQIYNGEIGRGSYYFVIAFMLIVAAYLVIPIVIYIIFWLYSIYQAFNYARDIH
ncbi:DUF5683 domain-containing protein [Methanolobus psychrotolerans]|uniref:DUF5683 domain-containing protein n=1 Tax=Methanolobus psychrotolerans TaxID=1874706 RepID=UPI001F5C2521|nr:DUF5683 domain-containing protein [Methanolobus psychrotolerans]